MKESIALNDQLGPRPTAVIIGKLTTTPMRPQREREAQLPLPSVAVADTDRRRDDTTAFPFIKYMARQKGGPQVA